MRPVAALIRLRSSTAVSESKPSSRNAFEVSTVSVAAKPSTAVTCVRIRSSSALSCSATGSAPSFCASPEAAAWSAADAVRLPGARVNPRSSGGTEAPAPRRAAVSRCMATSTGSADARVASNSARPSAEVRPPMPPDTRPRSASAISPVISLACSHRPQASESAGLPWSRRWRAKASTNALAAA